MGKNQEKRQRQDEVKQLGRTQLSNDIAAVREQLSNANREEGIAAARAKLDGERQAATMELLRDQLAFNGIDLNTAEGIQLLLGVWAKVRVRAAMRAAGNINSSLDDVDGLSGRSLDLG